MKGRVIHQERVSGKMEGKQLSLAAYESKYLNLVSLLRRLFLLNKASLR